MTRIAIISLLECGLLQITESRDWSSTALAILKEVDRGRKPEPGELSPIEACIMTRRAVGRGRSSFARTKAGDPDDQEAMPEILGYPPTDC